MAFFDNLMDTISSTSQDLSGKAKRASENAKLTGQIRSNEKMIEKLTYQVGLRYVEAHADETDSPYSDLFEEILRLRAENAELQKQIDQNSVVTTCPKCGHNNSAGSKFCSGCGAPLTIRPETSAEVVKTCPVCGAANPLDSAFCTECGNAFVADKDPDSTAVPEDEWSE